MGKFFRTIKASVSDFLNDECMVSGAALAYYTVFSLPPLLVVVFFVAGLFNVSDQKINEVVSRQIGVPVPGQQQSADASSSTGETGSSNDGEFQEVARRSSSGADPLQGLGLLSKIIGAAILIFSASGVFAQLQNALNRAWEVQPDPEQNGWKNFLAKRGLSMGMIVVFAFLLLVSLILTTMVDEMVRMVAGDSSSTVGMVIGVTLNTVISLALATLLFAAMYKILPDAQMRWKDMWVGAFITALLFVIGKTLIGWYLQNSQIGSAWGSAAASMIALLVWVYYSSIIVLYGAELTQAWAKNYGAGIVPEKGAIRVRQEKVPVQESKTSNAQPSAS